VTQARSDWAPDPEHPLPTFSQARRVPHGVTLIGKLFDEGTLTRAALHWKKALELWRKAEGILGVESVGVSASLFVRAAWQTPLRERAWG